MTGILIEIADAHWTALPDARPLVERAAKAALAASGAPGDLVSRAEIGIELADDATVQALNRQFRDRDSATNVLSFAAYASIDAAASDMRAADGIAGGGAQAPVLLGDVILAHGTVSREAAEQGKSLAAHTAHLVVHGVLHLLGHDHDTDDAADAMERLETAILAPLGVADPYRDNAAAETGTRRAPPPSTLPSTPRPTS